MTNCLGRTLLLLVFPLFLNAQSPGSYVPVDARAGQLETLRPIFERLYVQSTANLMGDYKKEYRKLYADMRDARLKEAEGGNFLLDTGLEHYFKVMLQTIKEANPEILAREVHFFVSRDATPNACTYPDGVILFNVGLLATCENESQIAFILCHELAHHELAHGSKSIAKRFDLLYSKQAQRDMANIVRQKNAYEKALAFLADLTYTHRRHGREHEAEADSLAARILTRTPYNAAQAIDALRMLDTVDSNFYTLRFDLKTVFNFPNYPFKNKWLDEENTLFQDGERIFDGSLNNDSLKTHPDCQLRAALMGERYLKEHRQAGKSVDPQGRDLFLRIKRMARYESLLGDFDAGNIGLCLFHTLALLQEQPSDVFLSALAGRCFNQLYAAQRDHVFSRYVQAPRLDFEPGYRCWLRFLNQLRLNELAAIGYHYLNTRNQSFLQDEEFQYQLLQAATNMNLPAETTRHKAAYLRHFPSGKHRVLVQQF